MGRRRVNLGLGKTSYPLWNSRQLKFGIVQVTLSLESREWDEPVKHLMHSHFRYWGPWLRDSNIIGLKRKNTSQVVKQTSGKQGRNPGVREWQLPSAYPWSRRRHTKWMEAYWNSLAVKPKHIFFLNPKLPI